MGRMWLGRLPLLRFLVRLWLPRQWVLWLWQWQRLPRVWNRLPRQWQWLSREWLSECTGWRASSRGNPYRCIRQWDCRGRWKTSGWSAWRTRWDYGRSRTFGRINLLLGASTWFAGNGIRLRGNSIESKPYAPSRNNFVLGTPNRRGSASKVHIHVVCRRGWPVGSPAGCKSAFKLVGC